VPQTNVVIEIRPVLLFTLYNTKNIAYHITEELIFYADKIMVVMGNSKNSHVFNFATLLKSRQFDAREIYTFYSIPKADVRHTTTCNWLRQSISKRVAQVLQSIIMLHLHVFITFIISQFIFSPPAFIHPLPKATTIPVICVECCKCRRVLSSCA